MDFKSIFKNKKVFVTGHTGFKGSWLISVLRILGAKTKGFSLEPKYKDDIFNLIEGNKLCESVIGNILHIKSLKNELISFKPDYVFHFAAQPLVRESYINPKETYETNVIGTLNLLESLKFLNKDCSVVIITTDKVYKNLEKKYLYKESDLLGGYDPYSSSKACVEILVDSYRNSFFNNHKNYISIATARAGNVIGGGDKSKDRLIPDIISSYENSKTLIIRNPNAVRPWQHVLEPLFGYLELAKKLKNDKKYSTAWNFGPNPTDAISVREIVNMSKKYLPELKINFEKKNNNDMHEATLLMLDISNVQKFLNWKPKMDAKKALELTLEWYKKQSVENPLKLVENQINTYLRKN